MNETSGSHGSTVQSGDGPAGSSVSVNEARPASSTPFAAPTYAGWDLDIGAFAFSIIFDLMYRST